MYNKDLREVNIVVHQSGENYKATSKIEVYHCAIRKIVDKWKTFKKAVNLAENKCPSKFTIMSEHVMLRKNVNI